ncbi:hypothetical protein Hanom_Chr17g01583201 [Helianthus anomalus]
MTYIPLRKDKFRSDSYIRDYSHYVILSPKNAILMKIIRRIKPKAISFFSSNICASIAINIGLYFPFFSFDITQELKVDFIMIFLIHVSI